MKRCYVRRMNFASAYFHVLYNIHREFQRKSVALIAARMKGSDIMTEGEAFLLLLFTSAKICIP
jgi:hypothetical protein